MSQKGRPVVEGSARQARLAARAARVAANGGTVKRGRPSKPKAEVEADVNQAEVEQTEATPEA
jgi:hypothetical protein